MNVVYPVLIPRAQICSAFFICCAAYASQSWMKVLFCHIIGPYGLTKGERHHYYCDDLTRSMNFFHETGAKKTKNKRTWDFLLFTVNIMLQFTHSGYAQKLHCIVQVSICSLISKLFTQCCWSVFLYQVLSICRISFLIICMHVCFFFFFYERNNLQSLFCFKMSQKTITGRLICCMSLQEVNIQLVSLFSRCFCSDGQTFFFFFF